MIRKQWKNAALSIGMLTLGLGFTGQANADYVGTELVTLTLTNGSGGSASLGIANAYNNITENLPPSVSERLEGIFEISDGSTLLGTVNLLEVELIGDPVATVTFDVTAASSDVTVTISSAVVTFDTLTDPDASAEAEVTLTDNNADGASLLAFAPNSGLFQAVYNGSTTHAELLSNTIIGSGNTITIGSSPTSTIAGNVSSIQSKMSFNLSAFDNAAGFGSFTVVPEPTSLALLSLGGLLLARRR